MLKINENEHFARNPMGLKIAVSWILYIYLFQVIPIFGQVELSSSFADNMVLQQNNSVPIWGTEMPMKGLGKSPVSGVAEFIKSSDILHRTRNLLQYVTVSKIVLKVHSSIR
nr:hypothetical protein [uncultured Allomuricauda sp.]